ncbi:MAG TPA: hypothetical protein VME41_14090 [Stellaceae bacterium]|nr:hypothetical protein [Stellaceae bacterium]
MNAEHVADQVLAAGAALAGLLLVFLGNAQAGYEGYPTDAQSDVRAKYMARGWLAFAAFASAIIACGLSLAFYWDRCESTVSGAAALLGVAFLLGLIAALITVLDIG